MAGVGCQNVQIFFWKQSRWISQNVDQGITEKLTIPTCRKSFFWTLPHFDHLCDFSTFWHPSRIFDILEFDQLIPCFEILDTVSELILKPAWDVSQLKFVSKYCFFILRVSSGKLLPALLQAMTPKLGSVVKPFDWPANRNKFNILK